jgi:porin
MMFINKRDTLAFLKSTSYFISCTLVMAVSTSSLMAAGAGFGGPESVENRLAEDDHQLPFKDRLKKNGLNIAVDYSALALTMSDTLPGADDEAASGMLRFYGSWDLVGRDTANVGSVIWKIEHRHSYTDTEPKLSTFNSGISGLQAPPFSDQEERLTNLYWKQRLNDGRSTVMAGFFDATDYVDVYAVASPWTGFVNFAFSTGTNTMALPGDAALGVAAATLITENIFVIAGVTDMESDPTKPLDGFDSVADEKNFFKTLELGWTSGHTNLYVDNIHITLWDADESDFMNQAADSGVNISASKMIGAWLPFVRAGVADKGSLLGIDKSISTGFAYYGLGGEKNNLGMAVNWADAGSEDQYTFEAFYLIKVLPTWEVTPDIQLIKNPASNNDDDSVMVYGLRTRLIW